MHKKDAIPSKWFSPSNGVVIFIVALLSAYCIAPILIFLLGDQESKYATLSIITALSSTFIAIGYAAGQMCSRIKIKSKKICISSTFTNTTIWVLFIVFLATTLYTAPSIPILSALSGASPELVSQERGEFLKGREGWWIALLYLSTIFTTTLVPYSTVSLYNARSRWRHLATFVYISYSLSFMQKALFLNLALPMIAFFGIKNRINIKNITMACAALTIIILSAIAISYEGFDSNNNKEISYFSAKYLPESSADYLLWRSISVPIFTAADTIEVHTKIFKGEKLLGATSSSLSAIFNLERINIERYVFEHQFGSWNETANSNAVFVIDAYVNFGFIGVMLFSLFIGSVFYFLHQSNDTAASCLWTTFAFALFSSSLIGTLMSNGFLILLAGVLTSKIKTTSPQT